MHNIMYKEPTPHKNKLNGILLVRPLILNGNYKAFRRRSFLIFLDIKLQTNYLYSVIY